MASHLYHWIVRCWNGLFIWMWTPTDLFLIIDTLNLCHSSLPREVIEARCQVLLCAKMLSLSPSILSVLWFFLDIFSVLIAQEARFVWKKKSIFIVWPNSCTSSLIIYIEQCYPKAACLSVLFSRRSHFFSYEYEILSKHWETVLTRLLRLFRGNVSAEHWDNLCFFPTDWQSSAGLLHDASPIVISGDY